jgi:cell division protein ZapA
VPPDKPNPNLVHVEIFGQTYAVKAGADAGYVESLAAFVDGRMKDVSRASGAVDSLRIAVLAALNVADELFRLRREIEEAQAQAAAPDSAAQERLARLASTLGAALGE